MADSQVLKKKKLSLESGENLNVLNLVFKPLKIAG